MIYNKSGWRIGNVADWHRLAPPARESHWRAGYSAMECALAWFKTGHAVVPKELVDLFWSHEDTRGLVVEHAIPECETRLDQFRNGRVHDMIALGLREDQSFVVGIEAKTGEPFGPTIGETWEKNPEGNTRPRITELCDAIFGRDPLPVFPLRYQLLHALAGTLIETFKRNRDTGPSSKPTKAIFVVHEMLTSRVSPEVVGQNAADLQRFLAALPGARDRVLVPGKLLAFPPVKGGRFVPGNLPYYVGKASVTADG